MAKDPTTPQGHEFQLRPGVPPFEGSGWRGVNTESDPGSLAPNELQRGDDVRLQGRRIITRPPLIERVNLPTYGLLGKVMALAQSPIDNPRIRLWFAEVGCWGISAGTGGEILTVDPTQSPVVQSYSSFSALNDTQPIIVSFGDTLFVSVNSALFRVVQIPSQPGIASSLIIPSPPTSVTVDFPGFTIKCAQEFDGKLFIGLDSGVAGTSKIAVWDGITIQDDKTAINAPTAMGICRNKLVVGFGAGGSAGADGILVRSIGAAPGTYAAVALGGFLCTGYGNAMQEVRNLLYIAGGADTIYSYDDSTATLAAATTLVSASGFVTCLTIYNSMLHYGWHEPATGASYVGRHDPDSTANEWVDGQKTIADADFYITSMKAYRQSIYCGGLKITIIKTLENDIRGAVAIVYGPVIELGNFQLTQIVRFP